MSKIREDIVKDEGLFWLFALLLLFGVFLTGCSKDVKGGDSNVTKLNAVEFQKVIESMGMEAKEEPVGGFHADYIVSAILAKNSEETFMIAYMEAGSEELAKEYLKYYHEEYYSEYDGLVKQGKNKVKFKEDSTSVVFDYGEEMEGVDTEYLFVGINGSSVVVARSKFDFKEKMIGLLKELSFESNETLKETEVTTSLKKTEE